MQTGASALLAAAGVATLYSLVHFFDLFRRSPEVAIEPQRIEFEPAGQVEPLPVRQEFSRPPAAVEPRLVVDNVVAEMPAVEIQPAVELPPVPEVQAVEEARQPAKASKRAKAPRKSSSRRTGSKEVPAAEAAPPAEVEDVAQGLPEVPMAETVHPAEVGDFAPERPEFDEPEVFDEPAHMPVAPLFEPEPFVRVQQRSMFGRKAG